MQKPQCRLFLDIENILKLLCHIAHAGGAGRAEGVTALAHVAVGLCRHGGASDVPGPARNASCGGADLREWKLAAGRKIREHHRTDASASF